MSLHLPPRLWQHSLILGLLLGLSMVVWGFIVRQDVPPAFAATHLTLLVPDGTLKDDVHVLAWQDAAAEVGFALNVVNAS